MICHGLTVNKKAANKAILASKSFLARRYVVRTVPNPNKAEGSLVANSFVPKIN